MALSHWLESEPRVGLLSWSSKTFRFTSQVSLHTRECINREGDRLCVSLLQNCMPVLLQHMRSQ